MPGSIRALRRQTDPVRGGGRVPITKRRTVGRPQYRETGTDTLSRQEEAIADAIEDAYATIPRETLLEAVESGDAAGYARTVLGYLTAASSGIEEVILESFISSGETSAIDLGRELSRQYRAVGKAETPSPSEVALRFRFNATDPRATTWARNEAGRLITNMATSEQEMFRRLVTQSFTEGRTPQSTASAIFAQLQTVTPSPNARDFAEAIGGNLNGLTERYERAVMNRVATVAEDLAARGVDGPKALDRMRKEGDKYSTKLRRARSRTIARTERMRAHNEARLLSYQQAIDDGLMSREHSRKVWSTGPFDVCPICVGMAGTEAKIADPFTLPNGAQVQSPPAHPNCRCTLQTRTDTTLYDPPQSLGTGQPGDPYRIGGRGVSDEGRKLDSPVTDTQRIHTTTRNGKSAYTPQRIRQVHDPWVRESLDDGVAYGDTQVTFMGGGSGAGKGSIQRSGDVVFRRGTTVVDSDEAKKAIPEYREMLDAGDNKAAAFVHEESSDMAQRLMAESIDRGYDTVLDGTGDSTFEKMAGKVARARQQGAQRVKAEYVTIDTDEALRRAAQRAARTGREVPEDVVTGTHEAVSKIFPKLADADTFDELRLWDNMGDTPELIYERVDGVERILNPQRWEAFLRKDPDYIPGSRPLPSSGPTGPAIRPERTQPTTPAARRARRTREQIVAEQRRRLEDHAERYGVTVEEAMMFLEDVPKLRERARAEAARRLDEVFAQLDSPGLGSTAIPDPRDATTEARVYYDWFRNLSRAEQSRLRQSGWLRRTAASVDEFDEAYAAQFGLETRGLPGQALEEHWLRLTREYDLLNQARRGRRPRNFNRYGGQPDYDSLLPDLRQEGWDVNVLMAGDEFESAAMIARTQIGGAADEAYSALGGAVRPVRGPAPWRMSFQSWEDEVRDLEYRLRNQTPTAAELERYDELVPPTLDRGQDFEALYSTIVEVARVAQMDVAEYATIPWL